MRLLLSFRVDLENYDIGGPTRRRPKGALFHRWLPDGRSDAIRIPQKDKRNHLLVWFECAGYVDGGFVKFARGRHEVDPDIMTLQGRLDAGPLCGEAAFAPVGKEEFRAIQAHLRGSEEYVNVGKRVIRFLEEPLSNFVNILRCQYGQYWLKELNSWDSRRETFGSYCSMTFNLRWREHEKSAWMPFEPTKKCAIFAEEAMPGRGYGEYLTQGDWKLPTSGIDINKEIPLALRVLGRSHELHELALHDAQEA